MIIPGTYSQRDPRWSGELLGFNTAQPYTIGNYGCTVTAIANMFWFMGHPDQNPSVVNGRLKATDGFVNGGSLVWGKVPPLLPDLVVHGTTNDFNQANGSFILADGNFAILQVTKPGFPMHFVLLVEQNLIVDSWDGVVKHWPAGYTFETAHLYGDTTPDFLTTPQPEVQPPPPAPPTPPAPATIDFTAVDPAVACTIQPGDGVHIRQSPDTSAAIVGALGHGATVQVTGYTYGANYQGNDMWLRTDKAEWIWSGGTNFTVPTPPAAPEAVPVATPDLSPAPAETMPIAEAVNVTPPATPDPEYVTTYQADPQVRVTQRETVVLDASAKQMPFPLPPKTRIDQAGTFTLNGEQFVRSTKSAAAGVWWGVPMEAFTPDPTNSGKIADISAPSAPSAEPSVMPPVTDKKRFIVTALIAASYGTILKAFTGLAGKFKKGKK